jgi:N-glycosylase/DNA lyase
MIITDQDRLEIANVVGRFKRQKSDEEIFYDLCFCLLVPQTKFSAVRPLVAGLQEVDFYNHPENLPDQNYFRPARYYNNKRRYISMIHPVFSDVLMTVRRVYSNLEELKREMIRNTVQGMGMKTTSHFLRDQGAQHLAIIDTHILKFMEAKAPKNNNEYLALESRFRYVAIQNNLTVAELDIFIWKTYSNTAWSDFVF